MHLRIATGNDWKRLRRLLQAMGFFENARTARTRFERVITSPEQLLVVAEDGDELVGYAWTRIMARTCAVEIR